MAGTNICTLTDSYKLTHHKMMPKGTEYVYSYFEFRKGAAFADAIFFGLQPLLKQLEGVVVTKDRIDAAEKLALRHFGSDVFDRSRWDYILEAHGGKLPVEIKAVPEGTHMKINNVMMTVVNTDPKCYWLTNHLETFLTHVWYPSTVATLSAHVKGIFKEKLRISCDAGADFPGLNFMLHDFGMRGVSSMESAAIGGAAHLVNFLGTDTVVAMELVAEEYGADVGLSVPASEHSVMVGLGKDREADVIGNLLEAYPTGILSVVCDSYDIFNCVQNIVGKQYREQILARDGKFVVRPDSGDPIETTVRLAQMLATAFGYTTNKKGFKVLNPKVGLIWGDGIDATGIEAVLDALIQNGFSAENMVFGMGGGLLQKVNRDTQRSAFKSSAQCRDGVWFDVYKDPLDTSKASKRGKLKLVNTIDGFKTVNAVADTGADIMQTVFLNGVITKRYSFEQVVANAALAAR